MFQSDNQTGSAFGVVRCVTTTLRSAEGKFSRSLRIYYWHMTAATRPVFFHQEAPASRLTCDCGLARLSPTFTEAAGIQRPSRNDRLDCPRSASARREPGGRHQAPFLEFDTGIYKWNGLPLLPASSVGRGAHPVPGRRVPPCLGYLE